MFLKHAQIQMPCMLYTTVAIKCSTELSNFPDYDRDTSNMPSRIHADEECDARDDNSSNVDDNIKKSAPITGTLWF